MIYCLAKPYFSRQRSLDVVTVQSKMTCLVPQDLSRPRDIVTPIGPDILVYMKCFTIFESNIRKRLVPFRFILHNLNLT